MESSIHKLVENCHFTNKNCKVYRRALHFYLFTGLVWNTCNGRIRGGVDF